MNHRISRWTAYELPPAMPKARPRMGRNVYMPAKYMEWKKEVGHELKAQGARLEDGTCLVELELRKELTILRVQPLPTDPSRSGLLTGDIDNYLGGIMDAAEGVLWTNDRNVWGANVWLDD